MKKVYKKDKKKFNYKSFIMIMVLFIISFLTIGFATSADELRLRGTATIASVYNIKIRSIALDDTYSNATSQYEEHTTDSISSTITLPNSDSTVTYEVEIINIGNVEVALFSIDNLPSNLKYTINNYTEKTVLCDDTDNTKCMLGSITTLSVTIGYADGAYDGLTTEYALDLDFNFVSTEEAIARIGNKLYPTIVDAVLDVPYTNTQTTIVVLNNTVEYIKIDETQTIIFDLNGKTVSSSTTNVFENYGDIIIRNGFIATTADQGAINNNDTGTLILDNVNMNVTMRQCLYNGGTATITGGSYLYSTSGARAAVHNIGSGVINIDKGVTIIATRFPAVLNKGSTINIGEKGGDVSQTTPLIIGSTYGVDNDANINFYDGILKGKTKGIKNVSKIGELEPNYELASSTETIDGVNYLTNFVAINKTVTFNNNGGSGGEARRSVPAGYPIGELPVPTRTDYTLLGWYDENDVKIYPTTIVNEDMNLHAEWVKNTDVAMIGNTTYASLQSAINAAPANTLTTITLLKNSNEAITIPSSKKLIIDLSDRTLGSSGGNKAVFETSGDVTIVSNTPNNSGKITSSANTAAVNVNAGKFTISSGQITPTGSRQAIYILGGTVEITGTAYLSSKTDGAYNGVDRATITNVSGTLYITGGTIEATKQHAVSNAGTLIIGDDDGTVSTTTPLLTGFVNAVKNTGTFNYYDGVLKGQTDAINGTVSDQPQGYKIVNVRDATYETATLELDE